MGGGGGGADGRAVNWGRVIGRSCCVWLGSGGCLYVVVSENNMLSKIQKNCHIESTCMRTKITAASRDTHETLN